MQSVPREWLDFLRQQFPKDSRIQLTEIGGNPRPISPGSTGKLDYIDDAGQFHVKWDNGCTLALVLGEDRFSVYLPEPQTFKLYMPLTADFYGRDEWGDMSEDGEEWDGRTLMDYEGQILINGTDIREWGPGRIAGFFSIVYQDFASDPMVLITPNTEKYQAFAGKPFPIEQLKEETFISREKGSGTYQAGKELLNELGIDIAQLRTAVEIRSTESVKQMVSEGLGVGLIAQSAAQDYVQFGKLLAFPFPDSRFRRQLYIVKHKNSILSPIAQVFYDYARKAKDKSAAE